MRAQSSIGGLRGIHWKTAVENNRPFQPINDGSNCGIYVMYYIQCIGQKVPFGTDFEPLDMRKRVAETLILRSEQLSQKCRYCLREIDAKSHFSVKCVLYYSIFHSTMCADRNVIDSETEEKESLAKMIRERRKTCGNQKATIRDKSTTSTFKCRLCRRLKR